MNIPIIYLITFISSVMMFYESKFSKSIQTLFYFSFVLIFSFIVSVRLPTSPDTLNYINSLKLVDLNTPIFSTGPYDFEIGFTILLKFFKYIFGINHILLFFLVSVLGYTLLYLLYKLFINTIKMKNYGYLSLFAFYTPYFGIYYQGIVLRAGISILLGLFFLLFLFKKKFFIAIIFIIFSYFFHDSSIVIFFIGLFSLVFIRLSLYRYINLSIILIFLLLFETININSTTLLLNFIINFLNLVVQS